ALEELVGAKMFVAGPHRTDNPDLKNHKDFGRYNPEFVTRLTKLVLPNRDDELRKHFQTYYDNYLRFRAREYLRAYLAWDRNPELLKTELDVYKRQLASSGVERGFHEKYWDALGPSS